MPKKTKKEKLAASVHRMSQLSHSVSPVSTILPKQQENPPAGVQQFQYVSPQKNKLPLAPKNDDNHELQAISYDLRKTVLLAIAAISVEVAIYWLQKRP